MRPMLVSLLVALALLMAAATPAGSAGALAGWYFGGFNLNRYYFLVGPFRTPQDCAGVLYALKSKPDAFLGFSSPGRIITEAIGAGSLGDCTYSAGN